MTQMLSTMALTQHLVPLTLMRVFVVTVLAFFCDPPCWSQPDTCFIRRNPRPDPVNRSMRNGTCGMRPVEWE